MNSLQNKGWVRFYRKSIDSSVWKNPIIWMVWSWCLLKANHQDNEFPFNGSDLKLKEGQFITGRTKALKEIPVSARNYRTAITYLKTTNRIAIKTTNRFSVFTIIKWKEYQRDELNLTNETTYELTTYRPATDQPPTINKNDKNDKNDKNRDHFNAFWVAYPRKTAKAIAEKSFTKIDPTLFPTIMTALETQKPQWNDPKYIPHASTWLNGKRWEDVVYAGNPMEAWARECIKKYPDHDRAADEFIKKYDTQDLLKVKHIINL